MKVFIDANVFFAAIGNPEGGSGFLFSLMKKKPDSYQVCTSNHAIGEAIKNIEAKLGASAAHKFYDLLLEVKPKTAPLSFTAREVLHYSLFVPLKDVPILGGADKFEADYLVTLDQRHLLSQRTGLERAFGMKIVNPGELLTIVRASRAESTGSDRAGRHESRRR